MQGPQAPVVEGVRWSPLTAKGAWQMFPAEAALCGYCHWEFRATTQLHTDLANSGIVRLAAQWLQTLLKMFSSI